MENTLEKYHLAIVPSVPVWKKQHMLFFDRKFYDGIIQYTKRWPGKITCILRVSNASLSGFGAVEIDEKELPFGCIILQENEHVEEIHLRNVSIVLASADAHDQLHISALCRKTGIKCVYVIEYIPETRYQIAALETKNPFLLFRRLLYIRKQELKRIAAFECCDGLQSNGTPAYDHYRKCKNHLLYFDTRVFSEHMIVRHELQCRLEYLSRGNPIRIAFSGRLIRMKGADHLVRLALKLKKKGLPFSFVIYGTGEQEQGMRTYISQHGLGNEVSMPGAVDFYKTLLPAIKQKTDLFVCLHRQSDPSCTYLETLSCGVPIVGYKNRAFAGILDLADTGWGAEMNDIDGIADIIERLNRNRVEIAEKSGNSIDYALQHDFETTFQKRIDHLLAVAG